MPSRWMIAAILVFWVAMIGLLMEREVIPLMIAEASPTYQIDLTDEIGSPLVGWNVLRDGKRIGSGTSRIHANPDRTYEFRSTLRFDDFNLLGRIHIRLMENMLRVNEEGKLQALAGKYVLSFQPGKQVFLIADTTIEIQADVVNDTLQPRLFHDGVEQKLIDLGTIDISQHGNIINPMHMVNRLRGLRQGQTWKLSLLDLLQGVKRQYGVDITKQGMTIPSLIADVKLDTLLWDHKKVVCFKIEYYEPGKEVTARTWVRRSDGLVLQQEANHHGFEMILQRIPT